MTREIDDDGMSRSRRTKRVYIVHIHPIVLTLGHHARRLVNSNLSDATHASFPQMILAMKVVLTSQIDGEEELKKRFFRKCSR